MENLMEKRSINERVLITVTGTWAPSHAKNWMECEMTWVSKLREKGFDVVYLVSNPHLDKPYERVGNFFFVNCKDDLDSIYLKNHYYVSQYVNNDTDYDYRFHTDSDTFIHPERFVDLLEEYVDENPKDWVGCTIPYPGFNTWTLNKCEILPGNWNNISYFASGGSGFLLSNKAMQILVDELDYDSYINKTNQEPWGSDKLWACDLIAGHFLYKNGINLWHDSRILFESKYHPVMADPHGVGRPFVGDRDSFMTVQHYCNGHMREIMEMLYGKDWDKTKIYHGHDR